MTNESEERRMEDDINKIRKRLPDTNQTKPW